MSILKALVLTSVHQPLPADRDGLPKTEMTYYVPHIATQWDSFLLVDNVASGEGAYHIQAFDGDGHQVFSGSMTIPGWHFEKRIWRQFHPAAESAIVTTENSNLKFRVAFVHPTENGTAEFPLPDSSDIILNFNFGVYEEDEIPLTWKGMALFNPGENQTSAQVWALSAEGVVRGSGTVILAARQRIRGHLSDFVEGISFEDVARIVVGSSQPLVGLNISGVNNFQLLFSLALPGVALPAAPGDDAARFPFPQHATYAGAVIKPSHVTQHQMDASVRRNYDQWKSQYLRGSQTTQGGYLVQYEHPCRTYVTVSEAHGYGMIITALMAGHDADAKQIFDGMVAFFDDHRSAIDPDLMDWAVGCDEALGGDDACAADGDLDIAYALILAHLQWGSEGEIDYLLRAKNLIQDGIKPSLIDPISGNIMLGDWDGDPYSTRSSDWMIDHCRVFGEATSDDAFWNRVIERIYANIEHIQSVHSPQTGLMPDFVVGVEVDPAQPNFLEGPNDGNYFYNACRWPWRVIMDYVQYAEPRALNAVDKVVTWIETKTAGDPSQIKAGYDLAGNEVASWPDGAFTAPLAAAAMVHPTHQQFLNDLWNQIEPLHETYYADTLNLMCQLLISGNWWKPEL